MGRWKSKKDGTHFTNDKKKRDIDGHYEITETEVKSNFEPMYDEQEKFAEGVRKDFENTEKRGMLVSALDDADRRFNIAISRMSEITKRVHELEIQRNNALRKEFLLNEIERNPDKDLINEYNNIQSDNRDILTYEEVAKGYRSMSRRKNELEEERNQYVKEIEELDAIINQ